MTNKHAAALGRLGGKAGKGVTRSGRPRIYPPCPKYGSHRFTDNRCPCGYARKALP